MLIFKIGVVSWFEDGVVTIYIYKANKVYLEIFSTIKLLSICLTVQLFACSQRK